MSDWKHGQTVFTSTGIKARYIAASEDGHVVQQIVVIYDGEYSDDQYEDFGVLRVEREVFKKPPVAAQHDQVKELSEQIAQMQDIVTAKRREAEDAETARDLAKHDYEEFVGTISKRHTALRHVENMLDGKIKIFVEGCGYAPPKVLSLKDLEEGDGYGSKTWLKLIVLFGTSNGDLSWRVNEYRDGSGGTWKTLHPCADMDEAKTVIAGIYHDRFKEVRAAKQSHLISSGWLDTAKKWGIAVPQDIADMINDSAVSNLQSKLEKLEADRKEVRQQLREARKP